LDASEELINNLEDFTYIMYGRPKIMSVNFQQVPTMLMANCGEDRKVNL
jgi:hypothetical protein